MALIRSAYQRLLPAPTRERLARLRRYAGAEEFARARRIAGRGFALRQLIALVCGWPGRLRVSFDGAQLHVRPGTSDIRTVEQIFVQRQYALPCEPEPRTILDAGANIGAAALFFAQRWPQAQIAALEPEPSNFALLAKNIRSTPSITAVEGALWHGDAQLNVANPNQDKWSFRMSAGSPSGVAGSIRGRSIPSLLAHLRWQRIDLLKIDIEGAERELFRGSTDWLANVGALMIEIHEDIAPGAMAAVHDALHACGFTFSQSGETWTFTRPAR
jgi:FkbM family methyltransferase